MSAGIPLDGGGPGKEESLALVAADPGDSVELFLGFHTFRDHCHAKSVRETHDGVNNGVAGRIVIEVGDEASINLDDVDRESLEVTQRAVPGSEIVEGELDAEILEVVQHEQGPFAVLDEDALGDFQDQQTPGWSSVLRSRPAMLSVKPADIN